MAASSLFALVLAAPAEAGKRRAEPAEPEVVAAPAPPAAAQPPPIPPVTGLFSGPLPLALPDAAIGLANLSAQGCNACHYAAHDGWASGGHGGGPPSPAFTAAVAEVGTPACTVCHLPLAAQRPDLVTWDAGDVNRPLLTPNPDWDATLASEGVTCVTCHLRGDAMVGARPPRPEARAPHGLAWSPELGASVACGACHQLTWPEAQVPFYDTFGEWSRSPQAAAGVQCQDCHLGSGASASAGSDHRFPSRAGRGLSALVAFDRPVWTRGEPPPEVTLTLQNTGAGHAVPTGSPYLGLRVEVFLEGPPDRRGRPTRTPPLVVDLARRVADTPPYSVIADTRLSAGEERSVTYAPVLDRTLPAGLWTLKVVATRTVRGEPASAALVGGACPGGGSCEIVLRAVPVRLE